MVKKQDTKVSLSGKVKQRNLEYLQAIADKKGWTRSNTLDRVLDDYFALEKNKEVA